ncbi:MAG: hypothetical protein PF689_12675 [Deltaproteobacteria bacterium]|jgi:hypothetical protein|nr:hypothetical protein [Deltaproteobacteria bacterium]
MYSQKSFSLHKFQIGISVVFVVLYLILIFCNYSNLTIFSRNGTGSVKANMNKATDKNTPKQDNKLIKAVKSGVLSGHEALFYEKNVNE